MPLPRFRLRTLLLAVVAVALGIECASLVQRRVSYLRKAAELDRQIRDLKALGQRAEEVVRSTTRLAAQGGVSADAVSQSERDAALTRSQIADASDQFARRRQAYLFAADHPWKLISPEPVPAEDE
jgi:hypothetical protein